MNITQESLKESLAYNPLCGTFFWRKTRGKVLCTSEAGHVNHYGYVVIGFCGSVHKAHRLAYLYMTGDFPPDQIDHINGDRADNRWCNLRPANSTENMQNKRRYRNNTSGVTGVNWHRSRQKWQSTIRLHGTLTHLGRYDDWFEAVCARKSAEGRHGFHVNHGRTA